jgi:hypothetical protein
MLGSGGIAPEFSTLALDGGDWSASHTHWLLYPPPPGKEPLITINHIKTANKSSENITKFKYLLRH